MARTSTDPPVTKSKRVWVQNVLVNAQLLEARLDAAVRRGDGERPDPAAEELEKAVRRLLYSAKRAATRQDPVPGRVANWWRGTLIEAAYQNLHAAEALIVGTYDEDDVKAELPRRWPESRSRWTATTHGGERSTSSRSSLKCEISSELAPN